MSLEIDNNLPGQWKSVSDTSIVHSSRISAYYYYRSRLQCCATSKAPVRPNPAVNPARPHRHDVLIRLVNHVCLNMTGSSGLLWLQLHRTRGEIAAWSVIIRVKRRLNHGYNHHYDHLDRLIQRVLTISSSLDTQDIKCSTARDSSNSRSIHQHVFDRVYFEPAISWTAINSNIEEKVCFDVPSGGQHQAKNHMSKIDLACTMVQIRCRKTELTKIQSIYQKQHCCSIYLRQCVGE
jgi:hypothetical protein